MTLPQMPAANAVSLSRLPLLAFCVALLYVPGPAAKELDAVLIAVLFLMDWIDGCVARARNQVTDFGGVLDIAVDRIVENVLWLAFLAKGMVGLWVPAVFLARSLLVDSTRGLALSRGRTPFAMMTSPLGSFLVASRFMRALYGLVKMSAFVALAASLAAAEGHAAGAAGLTAWAGGLVAAAVALNLIRGLPVLFEGRQLLRQAARPRGMRA
jgi:CDP-diacylglycerol--glycerol-3-phosphate 3-phosphatidyltransferase